MRGYHTDVPSRDLALARYRPRWLSAFWLSHAVAPAAAFGLLMAFILGRHLDGPIARSWAYDAARGWIGAHSWWAETVIHTGGRALIRLIAIAALVTWGVTFFSARHRHRRRGALYVVLGMLLSIGLVGLLKDLTNVDCPWNLSSFGGDQPYLSLFERRPPGLPHAACFPGAHSSSGFALMCFYFLLRDRSRRGALWALAGAVLVGVLFAFGQEARGAHFISHDLTSAMIVWWVLLALYVAPPLSPHHRRTAFARKPGARP